MPRSLILSGGGEYSDPWHPFAATSARVAALLAAIGHEVEVSDLVDERYCHLRVAPGIVPLAVHEHAGERHPLLWARAWNNARVVTDLLGHDERSYDSPSHRELITRAARWLTREI